MKQKQPQINIEKLLESLQTEEISEELYHRHALRRALLGSRYFDKPKPRFTLQKILSFSSPVLMGSMVIAIAMVLQMDFQDSMPVNAMATNTQSPVSFAASDISMSTHYTPIPNDIVAIAKVQEFETTPDTQLTAAVIEEKTDDIVFPELEDSFKQPLYLWKNNIVSYTTAIAQ